MTTRQTLSLAIVTIALPTILGCGGGDPGLEPVFPEDYAATFTEVRNCRPNGGSHDFNRIRVMAGPTALVPYRDRMEPFPAGAVVLKEEYDPDDADCTGPVIRWTAMERLEEGAEQNLGWRWQEVDDNREVIEEDLPSCAGCHGACVEPDGYEGTCTVP